MRLGSVRLVLTFRTLVVILLCFPSGRLAAQRHPIELYRDSYGTPTVRADRLPDALFALGYAMAQDNAERMARNYKQARGRVAEVDGRSALLSDGFLRGLGIEELATAKAKALSGEMKDDIESFCMGANRALLEQKGKIPDWIEPFTPIDVLAMSQLVNASFALMDIGRQLLPGMGSNQFAISTTKSATGHAILSMDPHLPWEGLLAWYEFGIETSGFRFHGITLSGLPFGAMGHTDRVAWCMTNNDPDLFDFFTVKTNPDNPKQYSYHGDWKDFEDVTVEMRFREGDVLKTQKQRIRKTAWGPIIPFRPQAVALSMIGSWEVLDQSVRMMSAKSAKEFREALRPLGLSMWNIVYADTNGEIGYQYNARVPRRAGGFDWGKPVPGDDPITRWGRNWSIDELPHAENPKSGLLVNANSAPWLTPMGDEIKRDGWPHYVTSYGNSARYDRLAFLLTEKPRISLQQARLIATDTEAPYSKATVAYLMSIYLSKHPEDRDKGGPSDPVAAVLSKWDYRADPGSKGAVLYYFWLKADKAMPGLAFRASRGQPWTDAEAVQAMSALNKAAEEMRAAGLEPGARWGIFHIMEAGRQSTGAGGFNGPGPGDNAAVVPNNGPLRNGKIICYVGSSFRMIVHLDPKRVESWSILPFGDSQNPASPHFSDQMALFAKGEYKPTHAGEAKPGAKGFTRFVLTR